MFTKFHPEVINKLYWKCEECLECFPLTPWIEGQEVHFNHYGSCDGDDCDKLLCKKCLIDLGETGDYCSECTMMQPDDYYGILMPNRLQNQQARLLHTQLLKSQTQPVDEICSHKVYPKCPAPSAKSKDAMLLHDDVMPIGDANSLPVEGHCAGNI